MKIKEAKKMLDELLRGSRNLNAMKSAIKSTVSMLVSHADRHSKGHNAFLVPLGPPLVMFFRTDGKWNNEAGWETFDRGLVLWCISTRCESLPLTVEAFVMRLQGAEIPTCIYSNDPRCKMVASADTQIVYEALPSLITGMHIGFPWLQEELEYLISAAKVNLE